MKRILIVDDKKEIIDVLERALTGLELQILAFTDPEQAYNSIINSNINYMLLITDIDMPGMSGIELAQKVKAFEPDIKILAMSGTFESEIKTDYFNGFISKPFSIKKARETVVTLLSINTA